jgi:hypothetical protein
MCLSKIKVYIIWNYSSQVGLSYHIYYALSRLGAYDDVQYSTSSHNLQIYIAFDIYLIIDITVYIFIMRELTMVS